ncbi:MAG: type II secretion system protein GspD [Candidatus Oxydemutatoraceae bacterium WSBS_2016_MAG_OTU14]
MKPSKRMKVLSYFCAGCMAWLQLTGCASWAEFSYKPDWTLSKEELVQNQNDAPPVYVRRVDVDESPLFDELVTANFPPDTTALQNAIVSALPFPVTVLVRDEQVDLKKRIGIRAQGLSVRDYLEQLENTSGYNIHLNPDNQTVEVSSFVTKTWHLPALAGMGGFRARLGLGSASNNESSNSGNVSVTASASGFERSHEIQTETTYSDDVWESVVNHAHCILETSECNQDDEDESNDLGTNAILAQAEQKQQVWLADNRRLGNITAMAGVQRIQQLDQWLQSLSESSLRMIRLDCAILDIALDEKDVSGWDIDAVFGGTDSINIKRQGGSNQRSANAWVVGAALNSGRFNMDLFLRNLSERAGAKLKSRAKLSVTNGATAYLNTGEIFSYVSDVNTVATDGVATTSFSQNRLQVGLEIAITPRLIPGKNKIMLEVVPVLSSLVRFDQLGQGNTATNAPVIALRQLSSQAITQNGRPITIGGLSWDKFNSTKAGFSDGFALSDWFANRDRELESRQLLIVITPQEINI